jgi:hypothetical protein
VYVRVTHLVFGLETCNYYYCYYYYYVRVCVGGAGLLGLSVCMHVSSYVSINTEGDGDASFCSSVVYAHGQQRVDEMDVCVCMLVVVVVLVVVVCYKMCLWVVLY